MEAQIRDSVEKCKKGEEDLQVTEQLKCININSIDHGIFKINLINTKIAQINPFHYRMP